MLKRLTFTLMMAFVAVCVNAAGEDSIWGLYFYSESAGLDGDAGTFKTTDSDGVFVLEDVSVAAEGINFCVHNADWSINYGWSDEGGSVDAADKVVKLAASTSASGWLALPAGNYDVTWDANSLTITFKESESVVPSGEKADWYIYFYSEEAGLNGDAGQFSRTDKDGMFVLDGCNIVAQGIGFCVHNAAWDACYGWSDEGGSVNAIETEVKLATSTTASGWLDIPVGTYKVIWNANDLTIRFENSSTTAIREVRIPTGSHVIYNIGGHRVNSNHKGMIIIDGKKYINR